MKDIINTTKLALVDITELEKEMERIMEAVIKKYARQNQLPEFLNGKQAQSHLHIKRTQLYLLRTQGKIPFYKMGNTILYKKSELDDYINEHKFEKYD